MLLKISKKRLSAATVAMLVKRLNVAWLAIAILAGGCAGPAGTSATAPTPAPTTVPPTAPIVSNQPTVQPTTAPDLLLVAVGDSIPFNSPDDCPGCTGFVDQYAQALASATGKTIGVRNDSQHNGLRVGSLLSGLAFEGRSKPVAEADIVIVGIAHNDAPWNIDEDSCDGPNGDQPDWSKYTDKCIATEVAKYTPTYEAVYERIAELRAGKPTILRTINRYNDWIGWPGHTLSAEGIEATVRVIKAWNKMICAAAEASGFLCADISTAINGPDGKRPSDGNLGGDYTHPSQMGNDTIARVLIDLGFAPLAP